MTRISSAHFGKELPMEDANVITAVLKFTCGTQVTLHFNSSCILNESFHLELFGDSGILRLGDPNTFGGEVCLEKTKNTSVNMPFTHGFLNQSRGLGAAEMAWSINLNRPHRAGMEMACHILEIAHGIFKSMDTNHIYYMTTAFDKPKALPEGYIGSDFWSPQEESALLT